jgi:hypothetical protein
MLDLNFTVFTRPINTSLMYIISTSSSVCLLTISPGVCRFIETLSEKHGWCTASPHFCMKWPSVRSFSYSTECPVGHIDAKLREGPRCKWKESIRTYLKYVGRLRLKFSDQGRLPWWAFADRILNLQVLHNAGNVFRGWMSVTFAQWLCSVTLITSLITELV